MYILLIKFLIVEKYIIVFEKLLENSKNDFVK